MTRVMGNKGKVKIGATAVARIENFDITRTARTADGTGRDDVNEYHEATGIKGWNGTVNVKFDPEDVGGQGSFQEGQTITLGFYWEGDSAGLNYEEGPALIQEVGKTSPMDEFTTQAFTFIGVGLLEPKTVAA